MFKPRLFHISLLILIALSAPAQAANKVTIDGPAPAVSRLDLVDKAAQGISNLEVVTFTGPSTAVQGDDLAGLVTTVIRNTGDPIVETFRIGVYLSETPDGPTGTRMGYWIFEGLPAGDTPVVFESVLVPLFSMETDYFAVLKLDYMEVVVETDETDNRASFPLAVTPIPRRVVYYEDFQDGPAGWTARDETAQTGTYINRIDYLDKYGITRGVWYCGNNDPSWFDPVGYGNNWAQILGKSFTLPDATPCEITYLLQYDSEPSYDYTRVEISNNNFTTYETLAAYDDHNMGNFFPFTHDISHFAGEEVQIRFRFTSDGAWSDEDGSYLSDGPFRLDEVTVTGSPTDDFEIDGSGWIASMGAPVGGEFRLEEEPYCPPGITCDQYYNETPGVFCNAWVAYDPATLEFPHASLLDHGENRSVRIVIESPPIDISDAEPGARFALWYDMISDLELGAGVYYIWAIRDELNTVWRRAPFIYYGTYDGWRPSTFDITDKVTPGASSLQIQLGAIEHSGEYPHTSGPSPYFDNVKLFIFDDVPPTIIDPEPRVCGWSSGDTDGDGVLNASDACNGETASFFDRDGDGCLDPILSGRHLEYWDDGAFPLAYYIHEDGAPGITDGSDFLAVQDGFNAWTTIPGAEISFSYGGTTPDGNANAIDLVNTVTFADPDFPFSPGVLAVGLSTSYLTPVWEGDGIRPGQIIDSDMIFNPTAQFRSAPMEPGTDIQSVVTHEAGHMLGLAHSAVQTSTMFFVLPPEEQASQLAQEDIQAMLKSYPSAESVTQLNHLRGTVLDGYDGNPVAGAIVYAIEALPGDALGDTNGCDFTLPEDGSYHFLGLPAGDYFIAIHPLDGSSSIGFLQPGHISRTMVDHAQTVFLPEFYNTGDSNSDPLDSRTPLSVGATGTTFAHIITNVDQTPPTILETSPLAGAMGVAVNSALLIQFSEPMDPGSFLGNFSFNPQGGGAVQGNAALASDDQTLMFAPTDRLDFDTVYEVEILGGVRDLYENTMGVPVAWTFTTETQPPVYIDNINPSRAIAGTPLLINGLGFDEGISGNTVTFGGIFAQVLDATSDQIEVVVPDGLDFGLAEVRVTNLSLEFDTIEFTHLETEEVARGHEVATLDLSSLPGMVAVSPAGDFAYVTTATGMAVVDLNTLDPPVFIDVEDGLDDLGVAPGGGGIFAVSSGGQKYYRFNPNNTLGPESEIDLSGTPLGIQVGPTGRRAYIAVQGGEIQVWDIDLSSSTFEFQVGSFAQEDPNLLGDMAMDPTGDRLFALTGAGNLLVYDVAAADLINEVAVQSHPVAVTIEPAGQYAYVTDGSGYLTVVSLSTLEVVADVRTLGDLRGAAVTPTGSFLYAANYENDNLDVIDLRQNESTFRNIVTRIPARVNPVDLAFSPDGVFAYSLVESERKFVVSAMGPGPILASASPPAGPVGARVVLAGSGFLAANGATVNGQPADIEPGATDKAMTIVIPSGAETGPITLVTADPGKVSNSLTFPVLESGPEGGMRLAAGLQPVGSPELGPVLAVSPVGGQLAVADAEGGVHLLDTRPGSLNYHQFTTVPDVHTSAVSDLAFSPDGAIAYAVSAGSEDLVTIDTAQGQASPTGLFSGVNFDHVAVSPDGSLVLVSDPGSAGVRVVDPIAGTESLVLVAEGAVGALDFHPGGEYVYLAVDSPALVILDLTVPAVPVHAGTILLPGTEIPVSLAFRPDGNELYVLTSELAATPNRSVVRLDTADPTIPLILPPSVTYASTEPLANDNLVLSPVGDRALVSISNSSGSEIFPASLSPWIADPQPSYPLTAQEIGMAFGPEGGALFIADPSLDQVLTFDFLGDQLLVPVWGEDQIGVIDEALPSPLRVRVVDQAQEGSTGVPVTFTVASGGGYFSVSGDPTPHTEWTVATDDIGYAQVEWVLGPSLGTQTVLVTSQGAAGSPWTFTATAISDPELLPLDLVPNLLAPAGDSTEVSVTTAIQAVFTKAVDPATIFESSYFLYDITDGVLVPVVFGFSDLDRRVSMTPADPLGFGKDFRVTLTSLITDLEGFPLTNPTEIVFSTELAPVVPTLASISPPSAVAMVDLVLSGSGLDPIPSGNQVRFYPEGGGAFVVGYVSESATDYIRTTVPVGAESGTVAVLANGAESNSLTFTVLIPTTSPADDVVADVRTGSATKSVTVSPDGAVAYAVSPEADLLIPVDLGTNTTPPASLPGIPVGDEPWALATHPDGTYVYVANRMSGDVAVVDIEPGSATWHEVVDYAPVGSYPVDIVVSPLGDRVYVANSQSNDLSVIDADESSATFNGVIDNVPVGSSTRSVTVSPDGGRLYIGTDDGYLVLGSLDYGVVASVSTGTGTKAVTVSPDGALLILLDSLGQVWVFDVTPGSGSENEVIANVRSSSGVKSATVSPDGALLMAVLEVGDIIEVFSLELSASVSVRDPDAVGSIEDLQLVATLVAGENPQIIAFDPTGTGRFVVTNAGDNTMSVFAIAEGPGLLTGRVHADCPDPDTSLYGVGIDVFANGTGEMPAILSTDETGFYQTELEPGEYTVTMVTPLGYTIEDDGEEYQVLEVASGDTTALDWSLLCQDIIPSPRRMSFWKHQIGVAFRGHGHYEIDGPTLCSYLDIIETSFNNHRLNQVVVYQPPESESCMEKLLVAKELLNLDGDQDMLSHARQELMALLFNVASEKLGLTEVISSDGAHVSEAITYVDQLIDDGDPANDETAMKIAKDVNKGKMINMGVIPDELPDFSYLGVPRKFSLAQNYPNPFNPKATINFEVAKREHVKLVIYDIAGRLVKTLVDEPKVPNRYVVIWDGKNNAGAQVASGVYFCRMVAGSFEQTHKMVLLK